MRAAIWLIDRFMVLEGRIAYVMDYRARSLRALDSRFRRLPCHELSHSRVVARGDYRPRVLPGGRQAKSGDGIERGIIARRVRGEAARGACRSSSFTRERHVTARYSRQAREQRTERDGAVRFA